MRGYLTLRADVFKRTLDAPPFRASIRRMDSETWLDKATRLQRVFASTPRERADEIAAARERIELALWLRHEFSDEPPEPRIVPFEPAANA